MASRNGTGEVRPPNAAGRVDTEVTTELNRLIERREEIRQQLRLLDRLAPSNAQDVEPHPREVEEPSERGPAGGDPVNGYLQGGRIKTVAVRLLAATDDADRPIHYQAWFELLTRAGFGIKANDPLGTFLTQVTRSPVVQNSDGPGLYRLDLDAPRRLHTELRRLQEELLRLRAGQQTLEGIASSSAP